MNFREWLIAMGNRDIRIGIFIEPKTNEADKVSPEEGDYLCEHLWRTLENINAWARSADTKAGIILAAIGVITTVYTRLDTTQYKKLFTLNIEGVILGLALIATLFSLYSCVRCIIPRIKSSISRSSIFFGCIASACKRPEDYKFHKSHQSLHEDLCNQVWINSHITEKKNREVVRATVALVFAIVLSLISGFISCISH